jgi:hypothetical protein
MRTDFKPRPASRSRLARVRPSFSCALALAFVAACSSQLETDAEYWTWVEEKRAVGEHDARNFPGETVYDLYVRVYPTGVHVEQARQWLADYRWSEATRTNTREGYLQYRKQVGFPTEYNAEADYRASLLGLPSREAARACMSNADSPVCGTLLQFRTTYPDTDKGREIAGWFAEYELEMAPQRARKDDLAYQRALDENSYASISRYAEAYPQGRHLAEARAEVARYGWDTLRDPFTVAWERLGRSPPLTDDGLTNLYVEEIARTGVVLTGCSSSDRLFSAAFITFVLPGARATAHSAPVTAVSATLTPVENTGIGLLRLDPGRCMAVLGVEQLVGVGSRFRVAERKSAAGEPLALEFLGHGMRSGALTIVLEGVRFEAGSVVFRRRAGQ